MKIVRYRIPSAGVLLAGCLLLSACGLNRTPAASTSSAPSSSAGATSSEAALTPYDAYDAALRRMETVKAGESAFTATMTQSAGGVSVAMEIEGTGAFMVDGLNPCRVSDTKMSYVGQEYETRTAYVNGYQYRDIHGVGYRQKISWEDYQAYRLAMMSGSSLDNDFIAFPAKDMRDAKIESLEEGGSTITAVVSAQIIHTQLKAMVSMFGLDPDSIKEPVYGDPTLTCTVNADGYITDYRLVFIVGGTQETADLSDPEQTVEVPWEAEIEFHTTYTAFGEDVVVPKVDADEYIELPESDFSMEEILEIYGYLFTDKGKPSAQYELYYDAFVEQFGKEAIDSLLTFRD